MTEEQVEVLALMEPLVKALPTDKQVVARTIIALEARGVFAWAVRSGYLLWSLYHPGEIPTMVQIAQWITIGERPF